MGGGRGGVSAVGRGWSVGRGGGGGDHPHRPPPPRPTPPSVSSDLVQLMEQIRVMAYLPSGAAGIVGGVVMLITYLGWSGIAGIGFLLCTFLTNLQLQRLAHKRNERVRELAASVDQS